MHFLAYIVIEKYYIQIKKLLHWKYKIHSNLTSLSLSSFKISGSTLFNFKSTLFCNYDFIYSKNIVGGTKREENYYSIIPSYKILYSDEKGIPIFYIVNMFWVIGHKATIITSSESLNHLF